MQAVLRWHNLAELLAESAEKYASRPFLLFEDRQLSFQDAARLSAQAACALSALGVRKGAHVAVMLPNGFDFPIIWLALARLGAVMAPVNINYQEHDLVYTLADSQAGWFIAAAEYLPRLAAVRASLPALHTVVAVGISEPGSAEPAASETGPGLAGALNWQNLLTAAGDEPLPEADVRSTDPLNLQYTSGTTGFPKGCLLPQRYWLLVGQTAADYIGLQPGDVNLTAQPYYYMDPQWNTIACLISGAALAILPRFSPSHFWQAVRDYNVSVLYLIGTMPFFLLKQPEDPALERGHRLRMILCSGIHPGFHAEFERRWGVPWREAYGMTETGVDLIVPLEDSASVGSGAMGKPIPTKQVRVVDAAGRDVPPGQVGELIVSGEPMMLGYWNNPEATAETLRSGWLYTGDLVYQDERGYYHWQARLKDTIRRAGENISSAEVESVLLEHPAVRAAAVVPVPDELRGQEVKAYLVLQPGFTPDPEAILGFARQKLAYFKVPRYLEFAADLPRTASERVEKARLVKAKPDLRKDSYDAVDRTWR